MYMYPVTQIRLDIPSPLTTHAVTHNIERHKYRTTLNATSNFAHRQHIGRTTRVSVWILVQIQYGGMAAIFVLLTQSQGCCPRHVYLRDGCTNAVTHQDPVPPYAG